MNDTTTYHQRQLNDISEAGGRYSHLSRPTVTGATPIPQLPQGAEWCSSAAGVPDEPPLGYDISAAPDLGEPELQGSVVISPDEGDPGADSLHAATLPGSSTIRRRA
jgi:hypothetical protein